METQIVTCGITTAERETLIRLSADDATAVMDSTIPKDFNRALKQGWTPVRKTVTTDGTVVGYTLHAPRKAVSLRNTSPVKRVMSDEDKAKMVERLTMAKNSQAIKEI